MSLLAAAAAGGALGARHALEADHLAAVATLVEYEEPRSSETEREEPRSSEAEREEPRSSEAERERAVSSPALVGASWGVGHTVPIAALGIGLLAFGVRLPESVTGLFEAVVGVVLVYLGGRMLAGVIGLREHTHGTHPFHGHLDVGRLSLGGSHVHVHGDSALVGALHGVAGSGALVVALVSTAPGLPTATAFLAAFGLASVLTMAAVSALWGRTLDTGIERALRTFAGVLGVGVGLLLVVEWLGFVG
jgi:hypothetical protein